MAHKIRVGVVFGGKSAEHEISLLSAKSVIEAINKDKYEVVLLSINKAGEWCVENTLDQCLLHAHSADQIELSSLKNPVALMARENASPLVDLHNSGIERPIDVVFPVLHGSYGEDGTIQGLLKLANIPFVGAGVLGSAVGMDKDVMKRLFRDAGIPTAKFLVVQAHEQHRISFEDIAEQLGCPFFVKPANLGSSIGVSKVQHRSEFDQKIAFAFQFDRKIIIEEAIVGRELECAVLGNEAPVVSIVGELIPQHEFYSYEAKYLDEAGALFEIPAQLTAAQQHAIQVLAIQAYQTLCCEGMARVDVFLKPNGQVLLNEINTIPGFTKISMYPKLWEASGLAYADLIDRLITLAIDRFQKEQALKTTVSVEQSLPVASGLE
jgi:D-alanine-D-alanine ligase